MAVSVQDDFWEAAQCMPDGQARDFIYALVRFGATGEEPEPGAPWYPTFVACRGRVELSVAKQRKAQRMAGSRWSKRDDGQAPCTDAPQHDEQDEPSMMHGDEQASCTDSRKHDARAHSSIMHGDGQASCTDASKHRPEIESESEKEIEKEKVKRKRAAARFSAPSAEDVRAYAEERGLEIDPAAFVDFYSAKGWRVGTSPMRDWRAAVRNWCRRDARGKPGAGAASAPPRGAVGDEYAGL